MNVNAVSLRRRPRREQSYWGAAWRELRRDWMAMLGLAIVVGLGIVAVFAPLIAPNDPAFQHPRGLSPTGEPLSPGGQFKLGTDALGRDELSRLIYGARVSLAVGVGGNLIAALVGILVGGVAGLAGSKLQTLVMRVVDVVLSFPILLLATTLLAVTRPGILPIMIIIGISFGAYLSRLVFSQVVSLREREFVLAAVTAGVRLHWVLVRHIVPHVLPSVLVFCTLGVATAIQLEAALSYIGIGIKPPSASWGNMIGSGQLYIISAPWLVAFPGCAIILAVVGFSLLGDGLRDALDPTLERRRLLFAGVR